MLAGCSNSFSFLNVAQLSQQSQFFHEVGQSEQVVCFSWECIYCTTFTKHKIKAKSKLRLILFYFTIDQGGKQKFNAHVFVTNTSLLATSVDLTLKLASLMRKLLFFALSPLSFSDIFIMRTDVPLALRPKGSVLVWM